MSSVSQAPSPAPSTIPHGRDLWSALSVRHRDLLAASDDHLRLCASGTPDAAALTNARWRVAQAGRVRMTLLVDTILPLLDVRCRPADRARLHRFAEATVAYRQNVSDHVKRWPIETIVAEWATYRLAAEVFRSRIDARIKAEATLIQPLLEQLDA